MAVEGRGRIISYQRGRVFVYLPSSVAHDSAFPFDPGDAVAVRIDPKERVVTLRPTPRPKTPGQ